MIGAIGLKRLLWGANACLAIGILLFCFQVLLRASETRLDLRPDDDAPVGPSRPRDEGDGSLKTLNNPVQKRAASPEAPAPSLRATLRGTLPGGKDPGRGVAFLRSLVRNVDLVAYVGGEILEDGRPCPDLRGWSLASVGKDTALFVGPKGEKVELAIDPGSAPLAPAPAAPSAKPVTPGSSKSRLLSSAEGRQVWGIDPEEIDWAAGNVAQILDRDLQVTPYAGGGLRLEAVAPESLGAARGLAAGDVLREVNGRSVGGVADLRALLDNPTTKSQPGLRLTIERAGKPLVLEYRPLPH